MTGFRSACMALIVLATACGRTPVLDSEQGSQPAATQQGGVAGSSDEIGHFSAPKPAVHRPLLGKAPDAVFGFRPARQIFQPTDDGVGVAIVESVAAIDIDGDGRMDLVTLSSQGFVGVYLQTWGSGGELARPLTFRSSMGNYSPDNRWVLGDFNEDGITDFAFILTSEYGGGGGAGLLLSRQGRSPVYHEGFPAMTAMAVDGIADWAVLDDDGDGHEDLVMFRNSVDMFSTPLECETEFCPNYQVLHGDGKGNFERPLLRRLEIDAAIRAVSVVDLDGDGQSDVLVSGRPGDSPDDIVLLASYGNGGPFLHEWNRVHALETMMPAVFADLNGDGRLDTISGTEIHFQEGNREFSDAFYLATYYMDPGTPYVADFNRDGQNDLVNHQFEMFYTIPFLAVYMGGDGTLQPPFFIRDPPWDHAFRVSNDRFPYASGDFNGDGCTDLAIAVGYDGVAMLDGYNCEPWPRGTGGRLPGRTRR